MEHAIAFSETGHLWFATLHANSANQALTASSTSSRGPPPAAVDGPVAEPARHGSQLPPKQDSKGCGSHRGDAQLPPPTSDLDLQGRGHRDQRDQRRKKPPHLGMQTFDQALFDLFESNLVTLRGCTAQCRLVNDLRAADH